MMFVPTVLARTGAKEMVMVWPGEQEAWDLLLDLDAKEVTNNAKASFNARDSSYALTCFGQEIDISLRDRTLFSGSKLGTWLITALGDYSRVSILRYMIQAMDVPLSGRLVRPSDVPGGDIFTKGTHILPLDKVAAYFSDHSDVFWTVGKRLGGAQAVYGDMSLNILPFPRVPVVMILWLGDEEFPSTASLLFDSSCVSHLPPDVIWSTSMMAVEMMLIDTKG